MLYFAICFIILFTITSYSAEFVVFQYQLLPRLLTVPLSIRELLVSSSVNCAQHSSCLAFAVQVDTGRVEVFGKTWYDGAFYEAGFIFGQLKETRYEFSPQESTPISVPLRGGLRENVSVVVTYAPTHNWGRCRTAFACDAEHHFYVMDLRHQGFIPGLNKLIVNYNMDGAYNWGPEEHAVVWSVWPFEEGIPFTVNFSITSTAVQVDFVDGLGPFWYDYTSRAVSLDCVKNIVIRDGCTVAEEMARWNQEYLEQRCKETGSLGKYERDVDVKDKMLQILVKH